MVRQVRIKLTEQESVIEVDGQDISCAVQQVTIDADAHGERRIYLALLPPVEIEFADAANVDVNSITIDALLKLGWTPPQAG
jgi:hypothetical protein